LKQNEWKATELIVLVWIAVLVAVLAYPLYGLWLRPERAPEWTQAILSTFAIAAGAGYVRHQHRLDERSRAAADRRTESEVVALLVFQLRQISYEVAYWGQQLDPVRAHPFRHYVIPGYTSLSPEPMQLDRVAFLFRQTDWGLLQRVQNVWMSYGRWQHVLQVRADFYMKEVQPRIKEEHEKTGIDPSPEQKEKIAGPVLSKQLNQATNFVYQATDNLHQLLQLGAAQGIEEQLRDLYPEIKEIAPWSVNDAFAK
jgi:hypothetical protein